MFISTMVLPDYVGKGLILLQYKQPYEYRILRNMHELVRTHKHKSIHTHTHTHLVTGKTKASRNMLNIVTRQATV